MKNQEYTTMFEYEDNYWWYVGLHKLIKHFVDKFSQNDFSKKILDAGCGTGKMLQILNYFPNSEGFDIEPQAIEFSKKRGINNIKLQDINSFKSDENNYDFIISSDVICCKGINDDFEICRNFYTALNHGGKLILNLPAFEILRRNHDLAVFIAKRYKRKDFVNDLKKIGFKIRFATYRLPFLFLLILLIKPFVKKSDEDKVVSDLKPIPDILNKILKFYISFENFVFKIGIRIPFGSSLFIVAEK